MADTHFRHARPGHLLQPALVNEVWQQFIRLHAVQSGDRVHFFSLCSRLKCQILDHARRRAVHERVLNSIRSEDGIERNVSIATSH
jgi:hypothetical protein